MTSPRLVVEQVSCVDAGAEDVAEGLLSLHCPLPQLWDQLEHPQLLQLSPLLQQDVHYEGKSAYEICVYWGRIGCL